MPPPVIFDLDDTLIRSFPGYVALHQRVARELGWTVPTIDELVPYGHDWSDTLERLFPGRDIGAFMSHYDTLAHEIPYDAVPGARAALETLRSRGHTLFIVTKRSRARLSVRLEEALIPESLFAGIFPREAQPAPKPDPRCFEPVWATLGVGSGADLDPVPLYVGDREEDRLAARGAGIRFVAVRTGPETTLGFPRETEPRDVLDSVADLPALLGG